jgi:DeoR/GlpR family transcriptional regulator of sugar metabolism
MPFKETRFQKIQEIIRNNGEATVEELAETFGVSEMTIRRDLNTMVQKGLIERTHGGAVVTQDRNLLQSPILVRLYENVEEKRAIARTVAQMIKRNEKIYLAAGTTTYWVAREIADRCDLTIVTNSLPIVNLLAPSKDLEVIVVGGFLRRNEYSLVGHFAENMVRDLRLDKVIMGIGGIHPEHGLTNEYIHEVMMDRSYMNISDNIIVVADHTKIGRVGPSRTADLSAAKIVVTSHLAPQDMVDRIRERGLEVIMA